MSHPKAPLSTFALLSLLFSLALPLAPAAAAAACTYNAGTHTISVTLAAGDQTTIQMATAKIKVGALFCLDGVTEATPTNTDTINITGSTANELVTIIRPTDFAPGFDAAEAGSAEIEWNIDLGSGTTDQVWLVGAEADGPADYIRFGNDGINTVGDEAAPLDVDIVTTNVEMYSFHLVGGDDIFDGTSSGVVGSTHASRFVTVLGGDGNDAATGSNTGSSLYGDAGDDDLTGGTAQDGLHGGSGSDDMFGGGGNDSFVDGSPETDTMSGGSGLDSADLSARSGDSYVSLDGVANDGARPDCPSTVTCEGDRIGFETTPGSGEGDIEMVYLGSGDDLVIGNSANNSLDSGEGNDEIHGGAGSDQLSGGYYLGGTGSKLIFGDAGEDFLHGATGNDELHGGADNDYLAGNGGNDLLIGGADVDTVEGGDGSDTLGFSDAAGLVVASLVTGVTNDGFGNPETPVSVEGLAGGAFGDILTGDGGPNPMNGAGGNDLMNGEGGADQMTGGAGNDQVSGGDGNDKLDGGLGADRLRGGLGGDVVLGGAQNDRLYADLGNDSINGGSGVDTADYSGATAVKVNLAKKKALGLGTDVVGLVEVVIGSSKGDVLIGDGRANRILGGGGNDTIAPGKGKDTASAGAGRDKILAKDGTRDRLNGGPGRDSGRVDRIDVKRSIERRI
jgi:Ca2+-binding RTX toxin-like protein